MTEGCMLRVVQVELIMMVGAWEVLMNEWLMRCKKMAEKCMMVGVQVELNLMMKCMVEWLKMMFVRSTMMMKGARCSGMMKCMVEGLKMMLVRPKVMMRGARWEGKMLVMSMKCGTKFEEENIEMEREFL
jgi:hypothetical protein